MHSRGSLTKSPFWLRFVETLISRLSARHLPLAVTSLLFLGLYVCGGLLYDSFFTTRFLIDLIKGNAAMGLCAVGMTLVILSGGIDLSVGSILAFATVVVATLIEGGMTPAPAICIALSFSTLFGLANGVFIQHFRLPPFLVTLAGMFFARGLAFAISSDPLSIDHPDLDAVMDNFGFELSLPLLGDGRMEAIIDFPIGGEAGQVYELSMHFYGIVEAHAYNNVERQFGDQAANRNGDAPLPFAVAEAGVAIRNTARRRNFNTYELHVYDNNGAEQKVYLLNSDLDAGHYTLLIDYAQTIPVIGGGKVQLVVVDNNCKQIKNCGVNNGNGQVCASRTRTVDVSAVDPQPPGNVLIQPGLGFDQEASGQWLLMDVTEFNAP